MALYNKWIPALVVILRKIANQLNLDGITTKNGKTRQDMSVKRVVEKLPK